MNRPGTGRHRSKFLRRHHALGGRTRLPRHPYTHQPKKIFPGLPEIVQINFRRPVRVQGIFRSIYRRTMKAFFCQRQSFLRGMALYDGYSGTTPLFHPLTEVDSWQFQPLFPIE